MRELPVQIYVPGERVEQRNANGSGQEGFQQHPLAVVDADAISHAGNSSRDSTACRTECWLAVRKLAQIRPRAWR